LYVQSGEKSIESEEKGGRNGGRPGKEGYRKSQKKKWMDPHPLKTL